MFSSILKIAFWGSVSLCLCIPAFGGVVWSLDVIKITGATTIEAEERPDESDKVAQFVGSVTTVKKTNPVPIVLNFSGRPQSHNLSCEAAGAAALARFTGLNLTESQILAILPKSLNPNRGFVGDPNAPLGSLGPQGYGVYAPPLAETLRKKGLQAEALSGSKTWLLRTIVEEKTPVMIWAVWKLASAEPVSLLWWKPQEGEFNRAVRFEHTYVVYGFQPPDDFLLWNSYPYGEPLTFWVTGTKLANSWQLFENMALYIIR